MGRGGYRYGAGRKGELIRVEDCRHIDVRRFAREDMLKPGRRGWAWTDALTGERVCSIGVVGGANTVTLEYSIDGASVVEPIRISRTACAYGNTRPWFACPRCGGRVALLYLLSGRFACRACYRLAYTSQSGNRLASALAKKHRLEDKLTPDFGRPKGMHHKTCARLQERLYRVLLTINSESHARTAALVNRLESMGL